jgi:hypothetical protein
MNNENPIPGTPPAPVAPGDEAAPGGAQQRRGGLPGVQRHGSARRWQPLPHVRGQRQDHSGDWWGLMVPAFCACRRAGT